VMLPVPQPLLRLEILVIPPVVLNALIASPLPHPDEKVELQ